MNLTFNSIEEALEDLRAGKMIIVCDDEDRENEGDFVMIAEDITPQAVNFMATEGRGIICTPLSIELAAKFELTPMVPSNTSLMGTPFTESIDLIEGNSTGISASDRYRTILALTKEETTPQMFMRPGHIFPLIARPQGVLERDGHTEAAVDLARICGKKEVGVICEIMNEDGTMARVPELMKIAEKWNLKIITIKDLIQYRKSTENHFEITSTVSLPSEKGHFELVHFESALNPGEEHLAIVKGGPFNNRDEEISVRVHSECFTGDVLGSLRCDCGDQLNKSLETIEELGKGVIIYLKQEGRGIGLKNKLKAYELQEKGLDTVAANHKLGFHEDLREYYQAAQMLKALGVRKVNLLTNNPQKVKDLDENGIEVLRRQGITGKLTPFNESYLETKLTRMGHFPQEVNIGSPNTL